jgi:arylsulfatase A-like enzyme
LVGLWLGAAFAGSAAETNTVSQAAPRRPNIVLILADELGGGDLGCYGQKRILTPQINALAMRGVRFTEFHAGAADDRGAREMLLYGGAPGAEGSNQVRSVAARLKDAGYHTGYIGYWGLGASGSPAAAHGQGFEEVVAYDSRAHARDLHADHLYRRDPHTGFEGAVPLIENQARGQGVYVPDLLTQAAVRFCRQNKPEPLNRFRPFFLVLSYPVPAAAGAYRGPIPETAAYADQGWPEAQQAKANTITRLDQHVGELFAELDKRGLTPNTIVLLTSSLGPDPKGPPEPGFFESTGRFGLDAGGLSEGRLRVPLIVSWPFWTRSARTSDLLTSGPDLLPTLLEAARVELPKDLPGISFLPTLQGRDQTNRHTSLQWTVAAEAGAQSYALKQGRWKLIDRGGETPAELYDCVADPRESKNVAEQNPGVVRDLLQKRSQSAALGPHGDKAVPN